MALESFINKPLTRFDPPSCETEKISLLVGIRMRLVVLWRPFAGNKLYLYNEDLTLVQDAPLLRRAKFVILSNERREGGEGLEGISIFDEFVHLHGLPTLRNRIVLSNYDGSEYVFGDEASFMKWDEAPFDLDYPDAHIQ